MLVGLLNGQRIEAFNQNYSKEQKKKWAEKGIILCPVCMKPYEYCHGEVVQPYFRHKDKDVCEDKYSEPETEEHRLGKVVLYEWIKKQPGVTDVELEGWLPTTKQRPDIIFKYNGELYVIEYQCSPIATEYYERHNLYQAAGIKDIWICGTKKYFSKEGKKCREKVIGKESGVYFNPYTMMFYLKNNSYEYYSLERLLGRINNTTVFQLPLKNTEFVHGIEISKDIKLAWEEEQKEVAEQQMMVQQNYRIIDKILYDFCEVSERYVRDSYEKLTVINKYYDKVGIQVDHINQTLILLKKSFHKEKYYVWNGKKNAQRSKWVCVVKKEDIPNSRFSELTEEFLYSFCKEYLG